MKNTTAGYQLNDQAHDPEEKRKRVIRYLHLKREGWPVAVVEKRSKMGRKRARALADEFGIPWIV